MVLNGMTPIYIKYKKRYNLNKITAWQVSQKAMFKNTQSYIYKKKFQPITSQRLTKNIDVSVTQRINSDPTIINKIKKHEDKK